MKERIRRELVNVEQALECEIADLASLLTSVENEYIKERAQDIRDVGNRVMRQLVSYDVRHYDQLPSQSIIVAHELLPSETIDLDREHVVGIVTEEGGENSHAAILSRALGIPAITGVADATSRIPTGARLLLDGEKGSVTITPSHAAITDFTHSKQEFDDTASDALAAESLVCETLDGKHISLLANINRPQEVHWVAAHNLEGVGLFRSEFLFMDSTEAPSFNRQVRVYREVIERLSGLPLVIRTLDLGGDKLPAFISSHHEANPNLGLRGLRFSLSERTMFETQLRAIITASDGRDVRILLPMVLGGSDLGEAVDIIHEIQDQVGIEQPISLGAMIETPAAVFALDEITELVDFVSIGTNDLTQFMLAVDRNALDVSADYSVLNPSVLRAISQVVDKCDASDCEVTVCGEAVGYARTAALFVGLGVRRLSMSPLRAAAVRYLLRNSRYSSLQDIAEKALGCDSTEAVRRIVQDGLDSSLIHTT